MTYPIRRALISVSDKRGIIEFAHSLQQFEIDIISTGGTARLLSEHGVAVTEVSDHTGFAEIMDGRVKTLHPKIHGGILGRREKDDAVMRTNHIEPIDLVVVNLYPFQQTIAKADCTLDAAIENIDIGGPAMLRAAAKNFADVTVVVKADDYSRVVSELTHNQGKTSAALRFDLAVKAFEHTAAYDGTIANYLGRWVANGTDTGFLECASADAPETLFPRTINSQYIRKQELRYGENPHQRAAFYVKTNRLETPSVANAAQLQGKAMSYNNIADTDAAVECVKQFDREIACVIVKHANPCGVAVAENQLLAYDRAYRTDAESAFGGIIAFNSRLETETAEKIISQQFVEVIVAPEVSVPAKAILAKKQNLRVLAIGVSGNDKSGNNNKNTYRSGNLDYKRVSGGLLLQEIDVDIFAKLDVVSKRAPSDTEMQDLLFAWKVAKFVKSNAIVYASGEMTIGIGAGQMSRVNSARIAAIKAEYAGLEVNNAVMASDAFFPFRDGIDNAAEAGIRAVIQPGGGRLDDAVIAAADEHDMAMVYTRMRHFRH